MEDHEESLRILRSNGHWGGAGADFNFTEFTNADTMQALFGLGGTPGVPSYTSNSLIASGSTLCDNTDVIVPRYRPPMEHIQAMGIPPAHVPEWTAELLRPPGNTVHIEEVQEVEPEYPTYPRPSVSQIAVRNRSGPEAYEWEKRKPEIYNLYINEGRSLSMVVIEMAKSGFYATSVINPPSLIPKNNALTIYKSYREPMYKRKFKNWRWRKNQNIKNYGKPDRESSIPEPYAGEPLRRGNYASTGTLYEESLVPGNTRGSTVAVGSPTHFSLGVPTPMRQTDLDGYVNSILFHVRSLYMSSMDQGKWKITNQCEVQEDIHDDLLVGVATALRNFESLGPKFGGMGMMKAFKTLEKVVADCGLFSLPTIWESFLRMIRKGHPQLAKLFLSHALQWSIQKSRYEHNHNPFVQALVGLRKIEKRHPHMLEQVIFCAYRSCIDHVMEKFSSFHLTTLSLWGDFVVYVDNSSASDTKEAVDSFRLATQRSEADNGSEDDYTLEILGLMVYVLQSRESMAEEAERVALDMLCRVNRRVEAGEKLEGNLLILWKDLRHTLGNFCHARGDLSKAVMYLEDYLSHGVVDDRDAFALEHLEEWYAKLGKLDEAQRVRQWRISSSQILLQEDDIELAECERVDKEGDEGNEDDSTDEDTYEDEGSDGQTVEDDDASEIEDAEVELQILRGEMEKLQQRMTILQKKVEKNKGKKTASSME
jgi:hypothetical protein